MSEKIEEFHNILIVDDIEINILVARNLLEDIGKYVVTTCMSGEEAIEIIKKDKDNKLDLILLDITMPTMDGFETCEKIRDLGNNIPIIFLSGNDESESLAKGFEVGGNDYIKKPFKIFELIARIDSQIKLSHLAKLQEKMKSLEMYNALVVSTNHNLRQPLTIIAGNIELFLMKEENNIDENSKKFLERATQSVEDAVKILDKLKYNKNPTFENYTDNLKMVKLIESLVEDSETSFDTDWTDPNQ